MSGQWKPGQFEQSARQRLKRKYGGVDGVAVDLAMYKHLLKAIDDDVLRRALGCVDAYRVGAESSLADLSVIFHLLEQEWSNRGIHSLG